MFREIRNVKVTSTSDTYSLLIKIYLSDVAEHDFWLSIRRKKRTHTQRGLEIKRGTRNKAFPNNGHRSNGQFNNTARPYQFVWVITFSANYKRDICFVRSSAPLNCGSRPPSYIDRQFLFIHFFASCVRREIVECLIVPYSM